jgi:hypothetical protein
MMFNAREFTLFFVVVLLPVTVLLGGILKLIG